MAPLWRPSPNFGPRRNGARPDLIVLHYTAMPLAGALDRLCDPAAEVSAHYLIARDGRVYHLVDEAERAWHAGAGCWGTVGDVNSRSIGIELDNRGDEPFAAPLMAALEALLGGVMARWAMPPERVIGHSDMAPGRKGDPGRRFDWRRLARSGLSVWPGPGSAAPDPAAFRAAALRFGYGADWPMDAVLDAFRQRFRPWATGPLSAGDMGAMLDLARRFPVDRGGAAF
ncbi:N-acetylmuramoyl-L-alanine amidase [Rhodovulum steppense]|uniref:N-acetylmuramoyl-L-alanine amidase n=1 Tax=Rhodovulum steppense TaxID=540251 RepID=A0A4R1YUE7_9RHOB|nr:N-acetylmuramoyl-L-alanine amidase [Rhodovulum steppense]TCM84373.1 N-acetylmuramoyl-L-alanine amidase [Rhodovulum steppense]